jgi:hypothetical protein
MYGEMAKNEMASIIIMMLAIFIRSFLFKYISEDQLQLFPACGIGDCVILDGHIEFLTIRGSAGICKSVRSARITSEGIISAQ